MRDLNKEEVQQRVLHLGEPIPMDKFTWDGSTKCFSSPLGDLVLDFTNVDRCTFKTGSKCIFTTGNHCEFTTGSHCEFITSDEGMFKTGWKCSFTTGSECTFHTGDKCIFTTENGSTFKTGNGCSFTTGDRSVIIRRYAYEVIPVSSGTGTITLCPYLTPGYLIGETYYIGGVPQKGRYAIVGDILSKVNTM